MFIIITAVGGRCSRERFYSPPPFSLIDFRAHVLEMRSIGSAFAFAISARKGEVDGTVTDTLSLDASLHFQLYFNHVWANTALVARRFTFQFNQHLDPRNYLFTARHFPEPEPEPLS